MLQWQERLAVLRGLSMWEAALALGLAILAAAQGGLEAGSLNKVLWRCEGKGAATEAVASRMTQTLLSFLDWAVRAPAPDDDTTQMAVQVICAQGVCALTHPSSYSKQRVCFDFRGCVPWMHREGKTQVAFGSLTFTKLPYLSKSFCTLVLKVIRFGSCMVPCEEPVLAPA